MIEGQKLIHVVSNNKSLVPMGKRGGVGLVLRDTFVRLECQNRKAFVSLLNNPEFAISFA